MAGSAWDGDGPGPPQRRFRGWLPAAGALLLLLGLVVATMVAAAGRTRTRAWPLLQGVVGRLQDDAGALDLYRRNPALASAYPTGEDFLARLRPLRPGLTLPQAEPPQGPAYRIHSGPWDLRVRWRGTGGTWMDLAVAGSGPFRPAPAGEGILRLRLSPDAEGLRQHGPKVP